MSQGVSKYLKELRLGLLDERSDDPSVFTGIGRLVNSLLGVDDETTIATSRPPTVPPSLSPNKQRLGGNMKPPVNGPTASNSELEFTSDRDWLEEAIAAAPLAPLSEEEEDDDEEETTEGEDDDPVDIIQVLPEMEEESAGTGSNRTDHVGVRSAGGDTNDGRRGNDSFQKSDLHGFSLVSSQKLEDGRFSAAPQ